MSDGAADDCVTTAGSRDRILDAALKVFGEKGYAAASTKEIALRAGVNEVTIFRNFNSKTGLFEAVFRERFPKAQLMKELHFDRGLEIRKVLTGNSQRLLNLLHSNHDLVRMVLLDLPRHGGSVRGDPISSTFTGPLSGYLAAQSELGTVREIDPEVAAEMFYGTLCSFYVSHYLFQNKVSDPSTDRRFIDAAVDLFLDGVRGEREDKRPLPGKKRAK